MDSVELRRISPSWVNEFQYDKTQLMTNRCEVLHLGPPHPPPPKKVKNPDYINTLMAPKVAVTDQEIDFGGTV